MTRQSDDEAEQIRAALEAVRTFDKYKTYNKLDFFEPYAPQLKFFGFGTTKRERMFMAGNQVGKTEAGAFETACHLTGDYPDWWNGKKFDHPIKAWAAGVSSVDVRDGPQSKLCGPYGVVSAFGTGYIPKERFADKPSMSRGVTDAYDTIQVVHKTNGIEDGVSTLGFKSYEQGREKFQGATLDYGWADEEPPMDVYAEFLTRIRGNGIMILTFTPLHGLTPLVGYFQEAHPDRVIVNMALDDAGHFTEEEKEKKIAGYLSYERDARRYGVPLLGSGRVFTFDESMIKEPYLDDVPEHWFKLWGCDFGVGHPFAAVLIAHDRDADVIHVLNGVRLVGDERMPINSQPSFHAEQMKAMGASVPVAWPHDGTQREKGNPAATIASIYRAQGLQMLPTHATFPDGGYSTEAGIKEMEGRFITGKLKVSSHLVQWFEEYRTYHRKDGLIVKQNDDLMSATRIAVMARRFAKQVPLGNWVRGKRKRGGEFAIGTGDNPLDW